MNKILLAGYYGYGNIGDEAILEMVLKQLCEITSINNITVLSGNPGVTSEKYKIKSIYRYNLFKLIKELVKSDILVVGGGSLLQDVTSKRSIHYYLFIVKAAQLFKKKVVMLSQGIGPINNKFNNKITASILKKVDYITVRDNNSKTIIENMGVNKNKIFFSADPVINFKYNLEKLRTKADDIKVCFSLREWGDSIIVNEICELINKYEDSNISFYFIPFHYSEDIELINKFEKKLGKRCFYIKEKLSAEDVYKLIAEMDLLIGVRLHSLIFAASAGIPFISISYDPKIDYFMENLGMDVFCNIKDLKCNNLYEEVNHKLGNLESEKLILRERVKELEKTTSVNKDILKKIM